jgi:hypothetical protein
MGWDNHDDRLYRLMEQYEDEGYEYPESFELALADREDELRSWK